MWKSDLDSPKAGFEGRTVAFGVWMVTTVTRPRFNRSRALIALLQHRCACPGCVGALASSEYASWRRCQECECHWTISDNVGTRQEGLFANPRCPGQQRMRGLKS